MSVRDWADRYISLGWQVVPLIPGKKNAGIKNWKETRFTPRMFEEGDNIGVKTVNGLVIVDVDCPEGVKCADAFLPKTGAIYGRESKPKSKWLYNCPETTKIHVYRDQKLKTTVIELRANHQDMVPESIHDSGEKVRWDTWDGDRTVVSTVSHEELIKAVKVLATASLMIRYYNGEGARHSWMLAFVGTWRKLGFSESETEKFVRTIARYAKDGKVNDRIEEIRSTFSRAEDEPTTGIRSFEEECQEPKLAESLRKIWMQREEFKVDSKGKIVANDQENIRLALRKLGVEVSYNQFSKKSYIEVEGKKSLLEDKPAINVWLQIDERFKFRPGKLFFIDVVGHLATQSPFHPVREYLQELKWDGESRIEYWLIKSVGADDNEYVRAVSSLPLLAAVKRILFPGCKFDEMLVLESNEQGLGRSSLIQALCPNEEWFSDNLPLNVDSKQVIERTAGKWIVEASELSGMRSSQVESLKSMLSRQTDGPVRLAYGHFSVEEPRQFIIIGTTNSYHYLIDPTGNRRFWPVRCSDNCDIRWVIKNRDQLWAEAYKKVLEGASIRLPQELWKIATDHQQERTIDDPWKYKIEVKLGEYKTKGDVYKISANDIWDILNIPTDRRDRSAAYRITSVMQNLGFQKKPIYDRKLKKTVYGWQRGSENLVPA